MADLRKSRRWQHGGMILGLFIGLVVGVGIAFGVVWYLNKTPLPFQDKALRAERSEFAAGETPRTPQPLPGKPGDKVNEKPRFEFYKILPGDQPAMPRGTAPAAPAAPTEPSADKTAPPPVAAAPTELLYLQAGAFQKPQDADNLKAKLAMLGLDVGVQEVTVPDKGTMHRVRVGPFASPDEMNRVRTQLSTNGVQATLVKVKPQ
ncbi:MAG: SPOR domain-containing protein [Sulfurisoma sp.]|nr:SPOR domain-containing protein [Sulfurisoma sp.]